MLKLLILTSLFTFQTHGMNIKPYTNVAFVKETIYKTHLPNDRKDHLYLGLQDEFAFDFKQAKRHYRKALNSNNLRTAMMATILLKHVEKRMGGEKGFGVKKECTLS